MKYRRILILMCLCIPILALKCGPPCSESLEIASIQLEDINDSIADSWILKATYKSGVELRDTGVVSDDSFEIYNSVSENLSKLETKVEIKFMKGNAIVDSLNINILYDQLTIIYNKENYYHDSTSVDSGCGRILCWKTFKDSGYFACPSE